MDLISKKDCVQEQKAGDNSNQIMVKGDLNLGITEVKQEIYVKLNVLLHYRTGHFRLVLLQSKEYKH